MQGIETEDNKQLYAASCLWPSWSQGLLKSPSGGSRRRRQESDKGPGRSFETKQGRLQLRQQALKFYSCWYNPPCTQKKTHKKKKNKQHSICSQPPSSELHVRDVSVSWQRDNKTKSQHNFIFLAVPLHGPLLMKPFPSSISWQCINNNLSMFPSLCFPANKYKYIRNEIQFDISNIKRSKFIKRPGFNPLTGRFWTTGRMFGIRVLGGIRWKMADRDIL